MMNRQDKTGIFYLLLMWCSDVALPRIISDAPRQTFEGKEGS